jgi:SNF2 family DNA or RNA helicase
MSWKFKTQPYKHQLDCLERFGRDEFFALLAEMGTGKSWIIINNAADLWTTGDCDSILILAPNGVHINWVRLELEKHMPDHVRWQAAYWSASMSRAEKSAVDALYEDGEGELRIFTMNWEALQTERGRAEAERFAQSCDKLMIVCDESDNIKNPQAQRSTFLMKNLRKYSKWRRIMTGTPVSNGPFDVFNQFMFLDSHILGTPSLFVFKARYAEMHHGENNKLLKAIRDRTKSKRTPQVVVRDSKGQPKYKNLDRLSKLIAPYSFRVLKKDCLDLPDKVYKTAFFELTAEQRKAYRMAEEELRLAFEEDITPINALAMMNKLAQITSGYYLYPGDREPTLVRIPGDNPKLDLLRERVLAITQAGRKVIIWARFQVEIADICETLRGEGLDVRTYYGETTKADRIKAIDDFQDGSAQVFVGNQKAGGTGITLTAASYVIYFSNDFSLRDRLQSEDRAHRIGQTESVTYYNLVGRKSIDEHVLRALEHKEDVAKIITTFREELRSAIPA